MLASTMILCSMVIYAQCTSSNNNNNNKNNKNNLFLKTGTDYVGRRHFVCLVDMQRSVSDSVSAPNTVTKRHKVLFSDITLHSEALRSAL